ncbi:MAG: hypothetical protein OEQ53_21875, partial [Saprospiraceae bacterium]|nr:hypothetical protein [Saprospiraceae bacterium]
MDKVKEMSLMDRAFIICSLLLTTLVYSPALLDYFHHSRFLFASISLTVFSLLYFQQSTKNKALKISYLDFALLGFVVLHFLSIIWARQQSEALFYAQKWLIPIAIYFISQIIIGKGYRQFIDFL